MEDLYGQVTEALAAFVEKVTGIPLAPEAFRLPREGGQLSVPFVRHDAKGAAAALNGAKAACPFVKHVHEKGGWLIFCLSDAFFEELMAFAQALPLMPKGTYLENRMGILARKGTAPCPREERVQNALWRAYLCYRKGGWTAEAERQMLTMTHLPEGQKRLDLENRCGGVALAILHLKGASR